MAHREEESNGHLHVLRNRVHGIEREINNGEVVQNGNGHLNGVPKVKDYTSDEDTSDEQKEKENSAYSSSTRRRSSLNIYIEKKTRWLFEPEYFVPEKQGKTGNTEVKEEAR